MNAVPCTHENFAACVNVGRLSDTEGGPITSYVADVTVSCAECGQPFGFRCPTIGMLDDQPAVSPDGLELHVPLISPEGYTPAFPGFRIRKVE